MNYAAIKHLPIAEKSGFKGSLATKEEELVAMLSKIKKGATPSSEIDKNNYRALDGARTYAVPTFVMDTVNVTIAKKLVIPKPGIKHYGTTATSLIIVIVCVGTHTRPLIANCVSVMCNPTPRLPLPTWLMMSHQTQNLLPINLFRLMMSMASPPCWHRPLI